MVTGFRTFMTGELYALLSQHSILARTLDTSAPLDEAAFLQGVTQADNGQGLLHNAFGARTLALFDRMPARELASYLSGILIGEELRTQSVHAAGERRADRQRPRSRSATCWPCRPRAPRPARSAPRPPGPACTPFIPTATERHDHVRSTNSPPPCSALPLVAILRGLTPAEAPAVGDALVDAGFRLLEVPLNSPQPLDSIALLRQRFPQALVGAGTVLDAAAGAGGAGARAAN